MIKIKQNTVSAVSLLATAILLLWVPVFMSNASDNKYEYIINELLTQQFDSLVTGEDVGTTNILADNEATQLYAEFLRWRLAQAGMVDTLWDSYSYNFQVNSVEYGNDEIIVDGVYDLDYTLKNGCDCSQHEISLTVKLKAEEDKHVITSLESSEVMFSEFSEGIKEFLPKTRSSSNSIQAATDSWLTAISEMESLVPDEGEEITENNPVREERAASYSYSVKKGVAYANKYYKKRNEKFYDAGSDCTNFVSQCVWRAYGGTSKNIANKQRMTGTWYAGSGGGSSAWESVEAFWNYTTKSKSVGPKGSGANNDKKYSTITAFGIGAGNVLQVRRKGESKYGHSVYVVSSNPTGSTDYGNITVAQHSGNTKRSLSDLISGWGGKNCYMRKISFSKANFDK